MNTRALCREKDDRTNVNNYCSNRKSVKYPFLCSTYHFIDHTTVRINCIIHILMYYSMHSHSLTIVYLAFWFTFSITYAESKPNKTWDNLIFVISNFFVSSFNFFSSSTHLFWSSAFYFLITYGVCQKRKYCNRMSEKKILSFWRMFIFCMS